MAEEFENSRETEGSQPQGKREDLKDYYRQKGKEYGDKADKRLNAMPVANRKKWFFIVFGCMLLMLVFNTIRAIRGDGESRKSVAEMVKDSIIDWANVDVNELSVLNLDSLASCYKDSVLVNPYFK